LIYRFFFRLVLMRLDAERAHRLATRVIEAVDRPRPIGALTRRLLRPTDRRLRVNALGLAFSNPLGVAAGMDKDARCFDGLGDLGFGHVEAGTVTAEGQSGHQPPRVGRLPDERAIHNRMGFPNPGAEVFADRLATRAGHTVVGVNVGKSMSAELSRAAADYRATVRLVAPHADYLVINVSSPNTPGLRSMQTVDELGKLVDEVRAELRATGHEPPLLVKIAPDLSDGEIDAIADLAVSIGLDGIVAVNTTVDRDVLGRSAADELPDQLGGISGAPLKRRALEVLRRLYARTGDRLVLISVGGIETVEDAWTRIEAGATLIQAHTGFVYGGPLWPRRLNRALARRVTAAGYDSIQEAVGRKATAQGGSSTDSASGPVATTSAVTRPTRVA
jgi:dihydroorotate dehydrogenase